MFLQNIDLISVKKTDEIEKEKKISCQGFLKSRPKKEGGTGKDKGL